MGDDYCGRELTAEFPKFLSDNPPGEQRFDAANVARRGGRGWRSSRTRRRDNTCSSSDCGAAGAATGSRCSSSRALHSGHLRRTPYSQLLLDEAP
jgi:hypothetical protein